MNRDGAEGRDSLVPLSDGGIIVKRMPRDENMGNGKQGFTGVRWGGGGGLGGEELVNEVGGRKK